MSTARNLNRAHAAISGIESRNGFLGPETLVRIVQAENFLSRQKQYSNERLRAFRDEYREFARMIDKHARKNLMATKGRELQNEWINATLKYLGYTSFKECVIPHWGQDGSIIFKAAEGGTHSVGLFFYNGNEQVGSLAEDAKVQITDPKGNDTFKTPRKESLSEQVERAMRLAEVAEAILVTPHFLAFYRADSKITGSCLEIRWADIFRNDDDTGAVLASSLFHADFFEYSTPAVTEEAVESDEDADAEDDEEESASGGATSAKLTPSQELFREDLAEARKITEDLHKQVMLALEILANERIDIDAEFKKYATAAKTNETAANEVFKDGLFVLYRILFVLYAESREFDKGKRFLPVENARYASFYSVEHLRDWSEDFLKREKFGETDGSTTYVWDSLKMIFTLLRRGVSLPGQVNVSAYNGQLFAPDRAPLFENCVSLRDHAMARVITTISRIGGDGSSRRLHFGNLGVEQLGAVYEALLAQRPVIVREPSVWVKAHPHGVGLVTKKIAEALDHEIVEAEGPQTVKDEQRQGRGRQSRPRGSATSLSQFIAKERPAYNLKDGRFVVAPLGGQRRQTASHYTPPKLAEFLVKRTLKPLVEGKSSKEILALKIVEPAVGSGGFLIACLRYMSPHLLEAKKREGHESLRGRDPEFRDLQECKREILERCLFGVDINPLSLELCRTSLYLEALVPGSPLPFLHHRLKSGNALVYADLLGRAQSTLKDGVIPNTDRTDEPTYPSVFDLPLKDIKVEDSVWKAWDEARSAYGKKPNSDELYDAFKDRMDELKSERREIDGHVWANWALGSKNKIRSLLDLSKKAIEEFEAIQNSNTIVDAIDARHRDRLNLLPDMDQVLIEAEGIEVNPRLERQRREALIREKGLRTYSQLVQHQRAFMRLKTFCDLHCALWFWPVDQYENYPSHSTFQELVNWLLDSKTLDPKSKSPKLSLSAFDLLKQVCAVARSEGFFQWHVEFAQIFGDINRPGFDVVISNPPWKVVAVSDRDIFPGFDPHFTGVEKSKKSERIADVMRVCPMASVKYLRQSRISECISSRWQSGVQSEIPTSGQNDLAILFVLSSERLLKAGGRYGILTSRVPIFVKSSAKELRQRLFNDLGLNEAISFINWNKIFEIPEYFEFSAIVGEPNAGKRKSPDFVHRVSDTNLLDRISIQLDAPTSSRAPSVVSISYEDVHNFSPSVLAIPGLTDPRQLKIASFLYNPCGTVTTLKSVLLKDNRKGLESKKAERSGEAIYLDDLQDRDLPVFKDQNLKLRNQELLPLFRGRSYGQLKFRFAEETRRIANQLVKRSALEAKGIDPSGNTVVWRNASQPTDQRTLVVSKLPLNSWVDNGSYAVQFETEFECNSFLCLAGSIPIDFLVRLGGGANRTFDQVADLPFANFRSRFLLEAIEQLNLLDNNMGSPSIDALVWLHYGQNKGALNRDNLVWMLDTQFDCLKRNSPEYPTQVIEAFDHYSSRMDMYGIDPTPIFILKKPEGAEIVNLDSSMLKSGTKKKKAS